MIGSGTTAFAPSLQYELGDDRVLGRITTVCRAPGAEIAAYGRARIIQGVQQAVGLVVQDWKPRQSQAYGSGLEETPHREAVHLEGRVRQFPLRMCSK